MRYASALVRCQPRLGAALLVLAGALTSVGCGVGADRLPTDIPSADRIVLSVNDNVARRNDSGSELVYLLSPDVPNKPTKLRSVQRNSGSTPRERLTALLGGPTLSEINAQLRTSIPTTTVLRSALVQPDGVLIVDITDDILTLSGTSLIEAIAQIVYTAYEFDTVRGVLLRLNGDARSWPAGNGVALARPLTTYDYPGLLETSQPDFPALPSAQG